MILPSLSEQEILADLVSDYKAVKKQAKKLSDKYLKDSQKRGHYIRQDEFVGFKAQMSSGNEWFVNLTFNQTKRVPWTMSACTYAEGERKTKDYYIVRGLNTDKPYYLKFSTHALMRWRERQGYDRFEGVMLDDIATCVFEHRETAIAVRYIEKEYALILQGMEDANEIEGMSHMIFTFCGTFFGYRTTDGNWDVKTFITPSMAADELQRYIKGNKKRELQVKLFHHLVNYHQYYNPWLYSDADMAPFLYKNMMNGMDFGIDEGSSAYLLKP